MIFYGTKFQEMSSYSTDITLTLALVELLEKKHKTTKGT